MPTGSVEFYDGTTDLGLWIFPQRQWTQRNLDVYHLDVSRRRPFVDHCRLHSDWEFCSQLRESESKSPQCAGRDHVDDRSDQRVRKLGALNANNAKPLTDRLNSATKSLNSGNTNAGVGQLGAFINQVNAFENANKLTAAEAQSLISAANQAITAAQCPYNRAG